MKLLRYAGIALLLGLPGIVSAQSPSSQVQAFHDVLEKINRDMLPMISDMLTVVQGIAGFGALWYIGYRVWKHLAAAESIDFFPLFRPFVIAIVISFYPYTLGIINGILKPAELATREMVKNSTNGVSELLEHRRKSILNNEEWRNLAGDMGQGNQEWEKYQQQEEESTSGLGSAISFTLSIFSNSISYILRMLLSIVLQVLYFAAALTIDALRSFHLLILALIGPFVLALSIFDGFQHLLQAWLTRYINVYLWLPICNLLGAMIGKIQQEMLKQDLIDTANGNWGSFGQTDVAYLIFLVIGIICYFSVPTIANYIIFSNGNATLMSKVNQSAAMGARAMAGGA